MSKFFTIVAVLCMTSGVYAANESYHVMTLDLVETILWNEGVKIESIAGNQEDISFSEELAVPLDLLDS